MSIISINAIHIMDGWLAMKRPRDFGARYGGQGFAIVLPNTDLDGATYLAETITTEVLDRI
jgi:PleD family two-component response regulator